VILFWIQPSWFNLFGLLYIKSRCGLWIKPGKIIFHFFFLKKMLWPSNEWPTCFLHRSGGAVASDAGMLEARTSQWGYFGFGKVVVVKFELLGLTIKNGDLLIFTVTNGYSEGNIMGTISWIIIKLLGGLKHLSNIFPKSWDDDPIWRFPLDGKSHPYWWNFT